MERAGRLRLDALAKFQMHGHVESLCQKPPNLDGLIRNWIIISGKVLPCLPTYTTNTTTHSASFKNLLPDGHKKTAPCSSVADSTIGTRTSERDKTGNQFLRLFVRCTQERTFDASVDSRVGKRGSATAGMDRLDHYPAGHLSGISTQATTLLLHAALVFL